MKANGKWGKEKAEIETSHGLNTGETRNLINQNRRLSVNKENMESGKIHSLFPAFLIQQAKIPFATKIRVSSVFHPWLKKHFCICNATI
jgi:hypothetical protein